MAISNLTTGLRPGVCTSLSRPTAPYVGQHIYETNTLLEFVWNGATWVRVYTANATTKGDIETFNTTPTRLPVGTNNQLLVANSATATGLEWQNNTSGLVLVAEQAIGNSVTQQSVSNVFTSTYTNYRIIMTGGAGSATAGVFLRLDNVATGYYQGTLSTRYDNVGGAGGGGRNNVDTFQIGRSWTDMISLQCELLGPQLAKPTTIQGQWNDTRVIAGTGASMYSGVQTSTTSFTGFTIFFDGGTTFTGGVIAVYGYRKTL